MPVEVRRAHEGEVDDFLRASEREALSTLYGFNVVWHQQSVDFSARDGAAVAEVALAPWWRRRLAFVFRFPGVTD